MRALYNVIIDRVENNHWRFVIHIQTVPIPTSPELTIKILMEFNLFSREQSLVYVSTSKTNLSIFETFHVSSSRKADVKQYLHKFLQAVQAFPGRKKFCSLLITFNSGLPSSLPFHFRFVLSSFLSI